MKPTIPDVIEKFYQYYLKNPVWGSLHIVLDDDNVQDNQVEFCIKWALENNDPEGKELAEILLTMSRTQRLKIGNKCRQLMIERGDQFKTRVKALVEGVPLEQLDIHIVSWQSIKCGNCDRRVTIRIIDGSTVTPEGWHWGTDKLLCWSC